MCNSNTWECEAEDAELEASLGYLERPYLKTDQPTIQIMHTTARLKNSNIHKYRNEGLWVMVLNVIELSFLGGNVLSPLICQFVKLV